MNSYNFHLLFIYIKQRHLTNGLRLGGSGFGFAIIYRFACSNVKPPFLKFYENIDKNLIFFKISIDFFFSWDILNISYELEGFLCKQQLLDGAIVKE